MITSLDWESPPLLAALVSGFSLAGALSFGLLASPELTSRGAPSPERGRYLFVQSCAQCHGDDARGSGEEGDGPDLFRLTIGNARIGSTIRIGIPNEMPSFSKKYGVAEVADLTAYLRTLH